MARDGSGNYTLPLSNVVTDTTILATWANTTMGDVATALTASIAKDGQTNPSANLPMNTFKHTGVGAPASRTDYMRVAEVVDGAWGKLTSVGGTADVITASGPYSLAAYVSGQRFSFVSTGTNTGAVTINLSGIGAKAITKNGATALDAGDLPSGQINLIEYDGTRFQLMVPGFYAGDYTPVADVGISFVTGDHLMFMGALPSGWSRTAFDNEAVVLTTNTGATPTSGGTVDFTTAFTSQAVSGSNAAVTLTAAQSGTQAHTHGPASGTTAYVGVGTSYAGVGGSGVASGGATTGAMTGGADNATSSHNHTFTGTAINLAVKYRGMNMIIKD